MMKMVLIALCLIATVAYATPTLEEESFLDVSGSHVNFALTGKACACRSADCNTACRLLCWSRGACTSSTNCRCYAN